MQDSNDQGSLVEAVKQVNTGEHEEDGPLALVLHHSRKLRFPSHHQDVQAGLNALGDNEPNTDNRPKKKVKRKKIQSVSFYRDTDLLGAGPQPNSESTVKASDLLPRKLFILDVEGLLVYAEGFMDRSSKTVAGDVVGAKKVIRRNGVQEFITRCLELFDIALWTCNDRNLSYDYTHYLFTGEQ
ncbi:hypothetical protein R1sor_025440 [Riccia sorocarpa]|uniref:FCP1 homology domain-containing protein n=1 Tax=Riccia sorocarpa TaxID=122646 RepID=A0ABD3GA65_9MARC